MYTVKLSTRQGSSPGGSGSDQNGTPTVNETLTSASLEAAASSLKSTSGGSGSHTAIIAIVIAIVAVIIAVMLGFVLLRRTRIRHKNPKYVPTGFLKKRWQNWDPTPAGYQSTNDNASLEPISSRTGGLRVPPTSFDAAAASDTATGGQTASGGGVDRNTSVRSVMTLPAYHQNPFENEQVLGREGDRGGIDVVIEFPETVDEEEEHREAEMEALYQVRLARRRENEEREERRRLRREARERGDYVALREIAAQARAATGERAGQTVEDLRAEHERIKKERQRAVSSVSYGDLGVARHDGTRLRANSQDSERTGLLGDAASIAASSHYHRRDRSTSSILSIDTMNSDMPSPRLTRSTAESRQESPPDSRAGQAASDRAGSSPEMIEHEDAPPHSPPGYENISLDTPHEERINPLEPPPDYSSPVLARGERPPIASQIPSSAVSTDSVSEHRRSRPISPDSRGISPDSRRASSTHIGQLAADRSPSISSSGGVPQLPSLRLGSLPSIHVDPGSPRARAEQIDERNEFE